MGQRENLDERRERLAAGPRLRAADDLLRTLRADGRIGDDSSYALAMVVIDAALDGDEVSLHSASRQLQLFYRDLVRSPGSHDEGVLEDRGRVLAFLDAVAWALERSLALGSLAELEQDSVPHQFLKAVTESPGMTNGAIASAIGISDAEASRIGRRLADAGLAAKRRVGRRNHWEPTPRGIQTLDILEAGGTTRFRRPHFQLH